MSRPRLGNRTKLGLICALWTLLIAFLFGFERRFGTMEDRSRDWLAINPIGRRSPENPALIFLGIDPANLSELFSSDTEASPTLQMMKEGFPWNREVYAHILDRLVGAGAKAVVFDMMFPAPRPGDEAFQAALDRYGDRVVLGSNLSGAEELANTGRETVTNKPKHILASPTLLPPGPPTDQRLGFVNVRADEDGIVRRAHYRSTLLGYFGIPPESGAEELLSLAARGLEKAGHADLIPNSREAVQFRFSEEFRARSVHEIFVETQWNAPPYNGGELFRDKIVLIGAAGNVAEDRLQTPFGARLGPSLHLSSMNAALNRDFLHATSTAANYGLIFGAGVLAWLCSISIQRPLGRFLLIGAVLLAYYGVVQVLFNAFG
ncbi:MAG TPA: CHASE2 domain-containing protein, partial [Chthoniobacteraceae bacterium]